MMFFCRKITEHEHVENTIDLIGQMRTQMKGSILKNNREKVSFKKEDKQKIFRTRKRYK